MVHIVQLFKIYWFLPLTSSRREEGKEEGRKERKEKQSGERTEKGRGTVTVKFTRRSTHATAAPSHGHCLRPPRAPAI